VPCPQNFIDWVKTGSAFSPAGVIQLADAFNMTTVATDGKKKAKSPLRKPSLPPAARLSAATLCGLMVVGFVAAVVSMGLRLRRRQQRTGMLAVVEQAEEMQTSLQE